MSNNRTKTKSILSVLLILLMLTTLVSLALAVDPETYSGSLGKNLTWTLDDQGTLTVRGTGNWTDSAPSFYSDQRIKKVIIEPGITEIENQRAFSYCENLKSVIFPNTLKSISLQMFYGCSELESVSLPDSALNISRWAFVNTALFNNDSNWDNDVLYIGNHLIQAKGTLSGSYTIKAGTLDIANGAFYGCSELTNVIIPESVKQIGGQAFSGAGLVSLNIPNGVSFIGEGAFEQCYWLETINIPNRVTTIEDAVFRDCHSLESISIPNSVKKIGEQAFKDSGCYDNEDNWSNDVLYIGDCLISAKDTLSGSYTVKQGTRLLADYAFVDCKELTSVSLPGSVEAIGEGAFARCVKLEETNIPNSITKINDSTFYACEALKLIVVPNSVIEIGDQAFAGCSILTSVEIPENVKSIGKYAFMMCNSLASVTISNSVTSIGEGSFLGCRSLTDVYFNGSEAEWNEIVIGTDNAPLLNAAKHFAGGSVVHVHAYTSAATTPATCKTKGVMTYTCACGDSYTEEIPIDPTAHAALNENGDCPRCGKHVMDVEKPTEPTAKPSEEKPAEKLNFFQRIIQWFRNLFARLFGR